MYSNISNAICSYTIEKHRNTYHRKTQQLDWFLNKITEYSSNLPSTDIKCSHMEKLLDLVMYFLSKIISLKFEPL